MSSVYHVVCRRLRHLFQLVPAGTNSLELARLVDLCQYARWSYSLLDRAPIALCGIAAVVVAELRLHDGGQSKVVVT